MGSTLTQHSFACAGVGFFDGGVMSLSSSRFAKRAFFVLSAFVGVSDELDMWGRGGWAAGGAADGTQRRAQSPKRVWREEDF